MRQFNYDWVYYLLRVISDVILISLIKTIFKNSMLITDKIRKLITLLSVLMITLNVLGIYRNSFTLWKYQDFMSYFWLGSDIAQLLYCVFLWCLIYFNDSLSKKAATILLGFSIFFCGLNIYNFLVNFKWFHVEGLIIFLFWFINNGAMILFSALVAYLIFSNKIFKNTIKGT